MISSAGTSDSFEVSSSESSGQETVPPLPLEVFIPDDHLPDILEVYDTDTIRRVTLPELRLHGFYHTSDAMWNSWEKFIARCYIKFVLEVRIPSMLKDKRIFIPAPPSSPIRGPMTILSNAAQ